MNLYLIHCSEVTIFWGSATVLHIYQTLSKPCQKLCFMEEEDNYKHPISEVYMFIIQLYLKQPFSSPLSCRVGEEKGER